MKNVFLFATLVLVLSCDKESANYTYIERIKNSEFNDAYSVIAHAGGSIDENRYTNSLEALMASIDDGKKLIELDLIVSSDDVIVAAHHWSHFKKISGIIDSTETPLSNEDFLNSRIRGVYTPINIFDINKIFSKYKDLILVTDKITNYDLLTTQYKFKDRLIVECFTIEQCLKAHSYGIKNVMFSINIRDDHVVETFISEHSRDIKIVAFNAGLVKNNKQFRDNARKLKDSGLITFAYSSNEGSFMKENHKFIVDAYYTDDWSLSHKACMSSNCNTY